MVLFRHFIQRFHQVEEFIFAFAIPYTKISQVNPGQHNFFNT